MSDFFGIAAIVACLSALLILPYRCGKYYIRQEAIENGVAEYVCDAKTGDCVFTWRPAK